MIMKNLLKYILAFVAGLFGAGIALSGFLGILENITGQINLADITGDILTVVIGLYLLLRVGLSPFKKKRADKVDEGVGQNDKRNIS